MTGGSVLLVSGNAARNDDLVEDNVFVNVAEMGVPESCVVRAYVVRRFGDPVEGEPDEEGLNASVDMG